MLHLLGAPNDRRRKTAGGAALWPRVLFALLKGSPGVFVRGARGRREEPVPLRGHVSRVPSANEVKGSEGHQQL